MERVSLLLATFCLAMSSGFLSGRLLQTPVTALAYQKDQRPLVPTIHIEGVRNGLLHGDIKGTARVIIGKEVFTQSGVFALDASPLLVNEISVSIPLWAKFVASKRGKKYYGVHTAAGQKITPKNRVYFRSEHDAQDLGYRK